MPVDAALAEEGRAACGRLEEILAEKGLPPLQPGPAEWLPRVFCCSPYLAKLLQVYPHWVGEICDDAGLERAFSPEGLEAEAAGLQEAADDEAFMAGLRHLRQRTMLRIALRDLLGRADLEETMQGLSALADCCIAQAYERAWRVQCERHGTPRDEQGNVQSLVGLAMGKLGGGELNFSSDVDLIFAYPAAGQTGDGESGRRPIDNHRFFIGQAQLLVKYLHEATPEGFVFRVDTRLRPFGDSGALAVSFDFMESYYQNQGREWERYAMIKARPVCGDPDHGRELMELLRPFVYRRYLDYGAFSSLREMKALIAREVRRKGMQNNIKLGAGGIREVEFIGQAFQLIRGGREPELRCRRITIVLERLAARGVLDEAVVTKLQSAYRFLRDVENRLQMVADKQVHRLPTADAERSRLAYAMGFDDWDAFKAVLDAHRDAVGECFQGVFFGADQEEAAPDSLELSMRELIDGQLSENEIRDLFAGLGFTDAGEVRKVFQRFLESHAARHMTALARTRLARLLTGILTALGGQNGAPRTLRRILDLLQAVLKRPVYLALLLEYPEATRQVIKLCAASGWIADYLARQPILLDSLMDPRLLYQLPGKEQLAAQLRQLVIDQKDEDPEQQLNALRHFKHEQVLRVAAVDVNEHLPLMKVSDQLTWLAEALLNRIHERAREELAAKYGVPGCRIEGRTVEPELGIIAYGKLGGIELGYGSDLDLVFVHNSGGQDEQTNGPREVDNPTYFARLGQRIVHWLATPTVAGVLYEVDLRLRPDGSAGMLVSSLEGFEQYQRERAWTFEHQALVRARMVTGSERLREAFADIRHRILARPRDRAELREQVRRMRERLRGEVARSRGDEFDLKHDRGGLGDIEFLVQYGVLAWAHAHPELTRYTDNIRILELFGALELLPADEAAFLTEAYRHLRELAHRRALEGTSSVVEQAAASPRYIDGVARIWSRLMEPAGE